MIVKTKAIVLSFIKYNDSDVIIKAFTQESGFISYYVKGLLKSKKGKLKKAFFQPNAILNLVATYKNKGRLEYIKEAEVNYHYKTIHLDFDKLSISIFMREVLLESLKNEQPDANLYQFIETQFKALDNDEFNPDFHLIFLVKLSKILGFFPQIDGDGIYFDMENGVFSNSIPLGAFLTEKETILLKRLLGTIFASKSVTKFSNLERKKGIEIVLKYYQLHIERFILPKSLKILGQIYQ